MPIFEIPPESYSRQIDERVQALEMPYGYTMLPPPADTGDFNQAAKESTKIQKLRKD